MRMRGARIETPLVVWEETGIIVSPRANARGAD